ETTATNTATASDSATYQPVTPALTMNKSHTRSQNEGTGEQGRTYSFTVTNTSTATTDPVTVTSLSDSVLTPAGIDLLAAFTPANSGSATLAYGASRTFTVNYTAPVANAGVVIANTVSVSGRDDETTATNTATASDSATYQNVNPAITVDKMVD